jgi:hypothetical protein
MDIQALAAQPIFTISLALCAMLTVSWFTLLLRDAASKAVRATATSGLRADELRSVEVAGDFHYQVEALLEKVSILESFASEVPGPFRHACWQRLLNLCDHLTAARSELNKLLHEEQFPQVVASARFLCGERSSSAEVPKNLGDVALQPLRTWHEDSSDLLQRLITMIEDAAGSTPGRPGHILSAESQATLRKLKDTIAAEN